MWLRWSLKNCDQLMTRVWIGVLFPGWVKAKGLCFLSQKGPGSHRSPRTQTSPRGTPCSSPAGPRATPNPRSSGCGTSKRGVSALPAEPPAPAPGAASAAWNPLRAGGGSGRRPGCQRPRAPTSSGLALVLEGGPRRRVATRAGLRGARLLSPLDAWGVVTRRFAPGAWGPSSVREGPAAVAAAAAELCVVSTACGVGVRRGPGRGGQEAPGPGSRGRVGIAPVRRPHWLGQRAHTVLLVPGRSAWAHGPSLITTGPGGRG